MAETIKLSVQWTKGLTAQEEKELRADIASAPVLRRRLQELIKDRDESASKDSYSVSNLDKDNWALRQAENCGYRRAMNEIIKLIP